MNTPQGAVTIYDGEGRVLTVLSIAKFRARYGAEQRQHRAHAVQRARRAARLRWARTAAKT